jgi:endophilin-B
VTASYKGFVQPLKKYLDEDIRTIMKERKILEAKRLDLDAAKSRVKKAKTTETQANAEAELKKCQQDFDRQVEVTRLLMEGISSAHTNHVRCLSEFAEAQITYYAKCQQHMCDLQRELASVSLSSAGASGGIGGSGSGSGIAIGNGKGLELHNSDHSCDTITSPSDEPPLPLAPGKKRARVLYDYDAVDGQEMSLMANEVLVVSQSPELDADWMMGERGMQKGRVPVAYLEILS